MRLNTDFFDTDFEFPYKGSKILVRNDGAEGESLYINGELQSQNFDSSNGQLFGTLITPRGKEEQIEVVLGGKKTSDCLIYADGVLIHPEEVHIEFLNESIPKQEKIKKKFYQNSLFFPFLMILIVSVFMIIVIGNMNHQNEASSKSNHEKLQEESAQPDLKKMTNTEGISVYNVDYEWNYKYSNWTFHLEIPEEDYRYYQNVDRTMIKNYSYYVKDPTDDVYLAALANKFQEGSYSDLDMVKNVILFVQSLEYLDDKVGTGYDEYPKFPLETLVDLGGDCEDSAILLASLLRELGYGAVLVQFQNHMGVGVKGDESLPGSYFEYKNQRYYYVETTSLGWEIGELPKSLEGKRAKVLNLN